MKSTQMLDVRAPCQQHRLSGCQMTSGSRTGRLLVEKTRIDKEHVSIRDKSNDRLSIRLAEGDIHDVGDLAALCNLHDLDFEPPKWKMYRLGITAINPSAQDRLLVFA
jgi:hypothetical protein